MPSTNISLSLMKLRDIDDAIYIQAAIGSPFSRFDEVTKYTYTLFKISDNGLFRFISPGMVGLWKVPNGHKIYIK